MPDLTRPKSTIATVHTFLKKRRDCPVQLWKKGQLFEPLGDPLIRGWETQSITLVHQGKRRTRWIFYDIENQRADDLRNFSNLSILGVMYVMTDKEPPAPGDLTRKWTCIIDPTGDKVPAIP